MDCIPDHVLDRILNNLSVLDLFRLQVVSRSFNNSCKRCLSDRTRLVVIEDGSDSEKLNRLFDHDQCLIERIKLCSSDDIIPPKPFKDNCDRILSLMPNLKDLFVTEFASFSFLNLKPCQGIQYFYFKSFVSTEVIFGDSLVLKYFHGYLGPQNLVSMLDKCTCLEGLHAHVYHNETEVKAVPVLLRKLPLGLKYLNIRWFSDDVPYGSALFASQAIKTLQVIRDHGDIPASINPFSAPELTEFVVSKPITDIVLQYLAMYSSKLKEVVLKFRPRTGDQPVYFPLRGLEKVTFCDPSDELVEILVRNNRNLQSFEVYRENKLTDVSFTHLTTLEHLTTITMDCNNLKTPSATLLYFFRNRASRPKTITFDGDLSYTSGDDKQTILELHHEMEAQNREGSQINLLYS